LGNQTIFLIPMHGIIHFQVHNSSLGVRLPTESPVRELITSQCLRQTMNQWFAHGQQVQHDLLPEHCCSACMSKCSAETGCEMCDAKLKVFEPVRKQMNSTHSDYVKFIAQMLTNLKFNDKTPDETPPYNPDSLAEAMVDNLAEFKNLQIFKDFLELFSLGEEISKVLLDSVEEHFELDVESIKAIHVDANDTSSVEDIIDESYSSDTLNSLPSDHSDEYFDESDDDFN
jgi:hypothetical protein